MIHSTKFKLKSRANFTELLKLPAKFGDFGVYLRSNFDAGLVRSALSGLPTRNCIQKRSSKRWKS